MCTSVNVRIVDIIGDLLSELGLQPNAPNVMMEPKAQTSKS